MVSALWLFFFLLLSTINSPVGGVPKLSSREESRALLQLKESTVDPGNRLSSWQGDNCCNWKGVGCSNKTGYVVRLDLNSRVDDSGEYLLGGTIDPSLLDLKHLCYLDLANNAFQGNIPEFLGSLKSLRHLDLSWSGFRETIPQQLGNLTNLQYLALASRGALRANSFQWLSQLSSLQYLDMNGVQFNDETDWLVMLTSFPSLSVLKLWRLSPYVFPDSLPLSNLSSLVKLDLSNNYFSGSKVPIWIFNITSLVELNLQYSSFQGPIPDSFGNLSSLKHLALSSNGFKGAIPSSIGNLCSLKSLELFSNQISGDLSDVSIALLGCSQYSLETLDLSANLLTGNLPDWLGKFKNLEHFHINDNNLNGSVPESLGQLSKLVVLDLSLNSLQGVILNAHFANLTRLEALFLSPNPLMINLSSSFAPPFQLKNILLGSCRIGPQFPSWLRTQHEFSVLDISNSGISDVMPDWFWNLSSQVFYLNVSLNQISGSIPPSLKSLSGSVIDLRSNHFQGELPRLNPGIQIVYLSNNFFSGDLQQILNETMPYLNVFDLSRNLLSGNIPSSICELRVGSILNLSNNRLSGEIPNCMTDSHQLGAMNFQNSNLSSCQVLHMASNNLSGTIPEWIGHLPMLLSLHLSNNSLHGEIPASLRNCAKLLTLDLGQNKLTGKVPTWIGESLTSLLILRLRMNKFIGTIPPQLSYLVSLQILDLAHNNLSGTIPVSSNNSSAMSQPNKTIKNFVPPTRTGFMIDYEIVYTDVSFKETLQVVAKGSDLEYSNNVLSLVLSLDLSSNGLTGEVPWELMNLVGLQNLNLSHNQLTGKIPEKIGDMKRLETLDISGNQLSGAIPSGIIRLNLLNHLNVSYNHLSGTIPSGNQLQTLTDPSIYYGNQDLCGFPLPKCPGNRFPTVLLPAAGDEDSNDSEILWFYLSLGVGYVVGFWIACGILLFKSSWRVAHFQFFDDMINWIYVATLLKMKRSQL